MTKTETSPYINRFHRDYIPAYKLAEARAFLYDHSLLMPERINNMSADELTREVDRRLLR